MRRLTFAFFIVIALVSVMPAAAQVPDETVRLRVGHFSPDSPLVDIYINGERTLAEFAFPDLTNWLELEPGANQIAITAVDAPLEDALLGPLQIAADAGAWYTVAIIGTVQTGTHRLHIIEEDFSDIPEGLTRITVFNAMTDGRPLSFFTNDERRVFGLAFPTPGSDQDGAFTVDIQANTYDLRLTRTDNEGVAFFSLDDTTLGSGRHYFIAAVGSGVRGSGIFVTTNLSDFAPAEAAVSAEDTAEPEAGDTYVRIGHFAADSAALDLYLNGQLTDIQGVAYVGLSEWITTPSGVYEIALAPTGTSYEEAVVVPSDATLNAAAWNTIAVVGNQAEDGLRWRVLQEDYTPIEDGQTRLTFFHAVPDLAPVDVLLNGELSVEGLAYPGASPGADDGAQSLTLEAGEHTITVTETGNDSAILFEIPNVPLAIGNHYFISVVRNDADTIDYYLQVVTQQAVIDGVQ